MPKRARKLPDRKPAENLKSEPVKYLAGDVCYERPMAERVQRWLRRCASRGATVLLGDPGRNYLPQEGLEELARYVVPTSRDLEDRDSRETVVWRTAAAER